MTSFEYPLYSEALTDVDVGVWSGRRLIQVGPWPSINIYQSWMRTFAIFGARAAQRRCPIPSNLGQKYLFSDRSKRRLEVGFAHLGWTAAFHTGRASAIKHV